MDLGAYLQETVAKPFVWGENDCCTMCANWMGMHLDADLLLGWSGEYSNCSEAMHLLHKRGGIVKVFERQIAGRAEKAIVPEAGAVGVMDTGDALIGAIYSGERWIVFSEKGMRAIPHKDGLMEAIWNLPNE